MPESSCSFPDNHKREMKFLRPAHSATLACALLCTLFTGTQATANSNEIRTAQIDRLQENIPAEILWRGLQAGKSVAEQVAEKHQTRMPTSSGVRRTGPVGIRGPVDVPAVAGERGAKAARVSDTPSRSMTRKECADVTEADTTMWVRSRFAMCESSWLTITWLINGRPSGISQFTGNAIATIPDAKSRTINFDYYYDDFVKVGTVPSGTVLTPDVEYTTVPQVKLHEGGVYPTGATWEQWADESLAGPVHHTAWAEAPLGQGRAPDDAVWAVWNSEIKSSLPPGWVEIGEEMSFSSFGLRWDFAPYLGDTPGASLSYNVSPLRYSKTGNESAVAHHIDDAINHPENTVPVSRNKNVPGTSPSKPLHRLYELYDPDRYSKNRDNAVVQCIRDDPAYASKSLDCDEYPFASTFEGTAQSTYEGGPRDNWSARPLDRSSNRSAGAQLLTYYSRNRILHGKDDEYYLEIIP